MSDDLEDDNGWREAERLVMSRLNEHTRKLDIIDGHLTGIKVDIGILKAKAGMWGAIAGIIAGGVISLLARFGK